MPVPKRVYKAVQDEKTGEVRIVEVSNTESDPTSPNFFMPRHSGGQRLTSNDIDDIKARSRDRADRTDRRMVEVIGNGGTWKP